MSKETGVNVANPKDYGPPRPKDSPGSWSTWFAPLIIIGGTLGIILCIAVFGTFWAWGLGSDHRGIWAKVVVSGRSTQIITIGSTVIRFCMSYQTILACMMVSVLAIHHKQVQIDDAPTVFMYPTRPSSLLAPLWRGWKNWPGDIKLHNTKPDGQRPPLYALICVIVLIVVNLIIQFTSTILVADLYPGNVYGPLQTRKHQGYAPDQPDDDYEFAFRTQPSDITAFAEGSGGQSAFKIRNGTNWKDSSSKIRAFIPMNKKEREGLAIYNGPANGVDAHVICMAIEDIADLTIYVNVSDTPTNIDQMSMGGSLAVPSFIIDSDPLEPVHSQYSNLTQKFEIHCNVTQGAFSICPIGLWNDTAYDHLKDRGHKSDATVFPSPRFQDPTNSWVLVSRASWPLDGNLTDIRRAGEILTNKTTASVNGSEWANWSAESGMAHFKIEQSLCVTGFKARYLMVGAERFGNFTEPDLTRINGGKATGYNTLKVEQLLGTERASKKERGTFELKNWTFIDREGDNPSSYDSATTNALTWGIILNDGWMLSTCQAQSCQGTDSFNYATQAIFNNTLKHTNDLSLALQSLLTVVTSINYYDQLAFFDLAAEARFTVAEMHPIPRKFRGFAVIIATIGVHFVLMTILILVFMHNDGDTMPKDIKEEDRASWNVTHLGDKDFAWWHVAKRLANLTEDPSKWKSKINLRNY